MQIRFDYAVTPDRLATDKKQPLECALARDSLTDFACTDCRRKEDCLEGDSAEIIDHEIGESGH